MENSERDKLLRDLLNKFKSEDRLPDWDDFAQQLDPKPDPNADPDPLNEENLQHMLSNYKPSGEIEGWERIQASLDAADHEFDEKVQKKINQFEPPYDPLSWPILLKRFADVKLLRAKLIALKAVEFAALILLVLTVVNMGRFGKFPFDSPLYQEEQPVTPNSTTPVDRAYQESPASKTDFIAGKDVNSKVDHSNKISLASSHELPNHTTLKSSINNLATGTSSTEALYLNQDPLNSIDQSTIQSTLRETWEVSYLQMVPASLQVESIQGAKSTSTLMDETEIAKSTDLSYITKSLASIDSDIDESEIDVIPQPTYIPQLKRTFVEFGILTQADYNRLRMPEDRLYSSGKQIVFPQQGIPSHGFGAGFTLAIGHPIWALETGLIYNAKDFDPGRELIVGGAFDNGSVEFQAMRLQVVSVPFQYRYRFDHKGRVKAYGLAGLGLNIIAQSDIDVLIKYHFASLSAGQNPNSDPDLAQTIRETRRISEHIRDGAPLSTKSFFSLNCGLGMEYVAAQHKTLFLQATYQYQVPNLKFSNNNGKHIRSVSLQAGVRAPLGS